MATLTANRRKELEKLRIKMLREQIRRIAKKQGRTLSESEINKQVANFEAFRNKVKQLESSGDYKAKNKSIGGKRPTSASGAYQFVKGSVDPAYNRVKRLVGDVPEFKELLQHKDASKADPVLQDMMFTADILQKNIQDATGKKKVGEGDRLLTGIFGGNQQAGRDLYLRGHHTDFKNPDVIAYANKGFGTQATQNLPFDETVKTPIKTQNLPFQYSPMEIAAIEKADPRQVAAVKQSIDYNKLMQSQRGGIADLQSQNAVVDTTPQVEFKPSELMGPPKPPELMGPPKPIAGNLIAGVNEVEPPVAENLIAGFSGRERPMTNEDFYERMRQEHLARKYRSGLGYAQMPPRFASFAGGGTVEAARGLASLGRGPDTELVHMTPREVGVLDTMARRNGLDGLPTNPQTGLPEAGIFDSIAPILIGAGAAAAAPFTGGGSLAAFLSSPLLMGSTAALGAGIASGFDAAEMAKWGLGIYGGANLAGSLGAAGSAPAATGTAATPAVQNQAMQTAAQQQGFQTAASAANPLNVTPAGLTASTPTLTQGQLGTAARELAVSGQPGIFGNFGSEASKQVGVDQLKAMGRGLFTEGGRDALLGSGIGDARVAGTLGKAPFVAGIGSVAADQYIQSRDVEPYEAPVEKGFNPFYPEGGFMPPPRTSIDPFAGDPVAADFTEERMFFDPAPFTSPGYMPARAGGLVSLHEGGNVQAEMARNRYRQDQLQQTSDSNRWTGGTLEEYKDWYNKKHPIQTMEMKNWGKMYEDAGGAEGTPATATSGSAFDSQMAQVARDRRAGIFGGNQGLLPTTPSSGMLPTTPSSGSGPISSDSRIKNLLEQLLSGAARNNTESPQFLGGVNQFYDQMANKTNFAEMSKEERKRRTEEALGLPEGFNMAREFMRYRNESGPIQTQSKNQGGLLRGPGDGMSDDIMLPITGSRDIAAVSPDEFVVPADVVSGLGNGSTSAGAKQLYGMMDRVRETRTGKTAQPRAIDAGKMMPV